MALLVVAVALVAPRMSDFARGRALDAEVRRLAALMHAGQSRAVSEGMPMVLWLNEKQGAYGLQEETPPKTGDAKAENLNVADNVQVSVENAGVPAATTFQNLPAIRFLPDGTIDENSPHSLKLTDGTTSIWLVETQNRAGYDVKDTDK